MHTRLIRVGKSQGVILMNKMLQQCRLAGEVDLRPTPECLLITPIAKPTRYNWDAQMQAAMALGQEPEGELLEGFADSSEDEWQW